VTTVTGAARNESDPIRYERHRRLLLGLVAGRLGLAAIAVPLAPFLYREHVVILVLLRPTKEVLLLAGFVLKRGDASLPAVVVAALPILVGGVWLFFALGRAYGEELVDTKRRGLSRRLLPPGRIRQLRGAVSDEGPRLVFLARLAAFPSSLVAAAAGGAEQPTRAFVLADSAGALLSMVILLAAGFGLGEAYDDAGPWVAAAGVAVLGAAVVLLGRSLKQAGRRR
jgi:membrane protein DedA with SNARE-associated domain